MKNNGEAHLILEELLEWHLELHFIFFERHLHILSMQCLLQWQLTNPCLRPDVTNGADWSDSELEGIIMVLNQVVSSCEFIASMRPLK